MYAGAVAVPLIVGRALNLSPQDMAILISADLFACGNGARSSTEARVRSGSHYARCGSVRLERAESKA